MKVIIRAFDSNGYSKDIATFRDGGRWEMDTRLKPEALSFDSLTNPKIPTSWCTLEVADFPEAIRYEIAVFEG